MYSKTFDKKEISIALAFSLIFFVVYEVSFLKSLVFIGLFIIIGKIINKKENNTCISSDIKFLNNHIQTLEIVEKDKEEFITIYNRLIEKRKEKNKNGFMYNIFKYINQLIISLIIFSIILNYEKGIQLFFLLLLYFLIVKFLKYIWYKGYIINTTVNEACDIFIKNKNIFMYAGVPQDRKIIKNVTFLKTHVERESDILWLIYKKGGNALINTSENTSTSSKVTHISSNGRVYSDTNSTTTTTGDIVILEDV